MTANTIVLRNKSANDVTNHVVSIGRIFAKGKISGTPVIDTVPTETTVLNRWEDGSVKFALLSWIEPSLKAGATAPRTIVAGASAALNRALPRNQVIIALTKDGVTKTASLQQMIADNSVVRKHGIETVYGDHKTKKYDLGWDSLKSIRPIFYVESWPTGQHRVRIVVENCDTEKMEDVPYAVSIKIDGVEVFSQAIVAQRSLTRWTKEFWIGGAPNPAIELDHNFAYLCSTKLFPNYDQRMGQFYTEAAISAKYAKFTKADYGLYHGGLWAMDMEEAGGRTDIGPTTGWALDYLFSFDERMRQVLFAQGEQAGGWNLHCREGQTGRFFDAAKTIDALGMPVCAYARPTAWIDENGRALTFKPDYINVMRGGFNATLTGSIADDPNDAKKSIVTVESVASGYIVPTCYQFKPAGPVNFTYTFIFSQLSGIPGGAGTYSTTRTDAVPSGTPMWTTPMWYLSPGDGGAHQPDPFSVLYMTTGQYYWLEQMQLWACTQIARYSISGVQGTFGICNEQLRGKAWATRNRWLAWLFSPDDDPVKAYLGELLGQMIAGYEGILGITGTKFDGTPAKAAGNTHNAAPRSPLGLLYINDSSYAPWQNNYLITTLGRMVESGYADVTPSLDEVGSVPLGIFNEPIDHRWLAAYYLEVKDPSGKWYPTWAATLTDPKVTPVPDYVHTNSDQSDNYNALNCAASSFLVGRPSGKALRDWVAANWYEPYLRDFGRFPNWAIVPR